MCRAATNHRRLPSEPTSEFKFFGCGRPSTRMNARSLPSTTLGEPRAQSRRSGQSTFALWPAMSEPAARRSGGMASRMARPEGVEPPAYRFEACRSIQLSYGRAPRSIYRIFFQPKVSFSLARRFRNHDKRSPLCNLKRSGAFVEKTAVQEFPCPEQLLPRLVCCCCPRPRSTRSTSAATRSNTIDATSAFSKPRTSRCTTTPRSATP